MITHFVGQEGGGLIYVAGELYSQQLFEAADAKVAGGRTGRRSCRSSATRASSAPRPRCGSRASQPMPWSCLRKGAAIRCSSSTPDPIRNRANLDEPAGHVLELPGDSLAAGGHGAGTARRPANAESVRPADPARFAAFRTGPDGLHRIRQHVSLALSLGGLLRRLLGATGRPRRPQQGARRSVPVHGASGKERLPGGRSGFGRRSLHGPGRARRGDRAGRGPGSRRSAIGTAAVRESGR